MVDRKDTTLVRGNVSGTQRFNDHFDGVEEQLALMAQEIHTLRIENEELTAMVDLQAKELAHREKICREGFGAEPSNRATGTGQRKPRSTVGNLPSSRRSSTAAHSRNGYEPQSLRHSQSRATESSSTSGFKKSPQLGRSALPAYSLIAPTLLPNHALASITETPSVLSAHRPTRSQITGPHCVPSTTASSASANAPITISSTAITPEAGHGQPWSVEFGNEEESVLDVEMVLSLPHEKQVWCVKFSSDGKYLAAGGRKGKAQIYDLRTGLLTCVLVDLTASSWGINAVCFSPNGRFLATGADDGLIRIWKIDDKHLRNSFKGHAGFVTSLTFSPNGQLLVSASSDNSTRVWRMRDGVSRVFRDPSSFGAVSCISLSPSGNHVVAAHEDRVVRIWDMRAGQLVGKLTGHSDWVRTVAFMPDGKGVVSGSEDKTVKYWDVSSVRTLRPEEKWPLNFEKVKMDNLLGFIRMKKRNGPLKLEFLGHKDYVRSVATSPNGLWVASGSDDQSIRIWHTGKAKMECVLKGHKRFVCSVDFSPSGNYLVSGDSGGRVMVWRYEHNLSRKMFTG